jgi:hypothetical protein
MEELELVVGGNSGSQVVAFPSNHFTLGSAPDCAVRFDARLIKPRHAEVFREEDGSWWIRDTSGSGTVWVNGFTTLESSIAAGAFIKVGKLEFSVRTASSGPHGTMKAPTPMPTRGSKGPARATPTATRRSAASGNAHELQPGELIDNRYRIISKLAAGGMGEVYRAEHIELSKTFALKVMLPSLSNDQDFVQRFKREAVASSRIGQQNIVDISDFGTSGGRFFFVMEFLEGRTLASVVREEGALPAPRVIQIGLQVARALAAAHHQSIVHRDLKPENVMLLQRPGQADFVKVLDFGIAKVSTGQGASEHTAVGMVVGTPQYMSPEQAAGLAVDPRSDIYALGLILYELLAGKPTFQGQTPSLLMLAQMSTPPPPLVLTPPLPSQLQRLVFQMLEKEANNRPPTMEEVITRLEEAMGQLRSAPTGVAAQQPVTKVEASRAPLFVALAVLALIAAGAVVLFASKSTPPTVIELPDLPAPQAAAALAPAPAVARISLSITSSPSGATVTRVDTDEVLGVTPLTVSLPRSEQATDVRLTLEDHEPMVHHVSFEANASYVVQLSPVPKPTLAPKKPAVPKKPKAKTSNESTVDPFENQ